MYERVSGFLIESIFPRIEMHSGEDVFECAGAEWNGNASDHLTLAVLEVGRWRIFTAGNRDWSPSIELDRVPINL